MKRICILRSDEKYAKEVESTVNELKNQANETKGKFKNQSNQKQMDTVIDEVGKYEAAFNNYHNLFNEKKEAEKSMIKNGRTIEKIAEELKAD